MYRRHTGQLSMLDDPEFFGSLPLDPNNRWIKLSKQIPWQEFDLKYRENFKSKKGQPACDSRMALGAVLLKPAYKGLSDDDITQVIAENPYLQHSSSQFNVYMKRRIWGLNQAGVQDVGGDVRKIRDFTRFCVSKN